MLVAQKQEEPRQAVGLVALLNQLLANTIDLRLSVKQAHWNIRGGGFIALHELLDKVSAAVDEYADLVAERVVQLGGTAEGTLKIAYEQSSLVAYPVDIHESSEHVRLLSGALSVLADAHRRAITTATEAGDLVTADILTEVTRGLDKLQWFVRSHING